MGRPRPQSAATPDWLRARAPHTLTGEPLPRLTTGRTCRDQDIAAALAGARGPGAAGPAGAGPGAQEGLARPDAAHRPDPGAVRQGVRPRHAGAGPVPGLVPDGR